MRSEYLPIQPAHLDRHPGCLPCRAPPRRCPAVVLQTWMLLRGRSPSSMEALPPVVSPEPDSDHTRSLPRRRAQVARRSWLRPDTFAGTSWRRFAAHRFVGIRQSISPVCSARPMHPSADRRSNLSEGRRGFFAQHGVPSAAVRSRLPFDL